MGPLELCLLPLLLLTQEPAPPAPAPTATAPSTATTTATSTEAAAEELLAADETSQDPAPLPRSVDPAELASLQAAERAGAKAEPGELARLAASADADIAARATWLLGTSKHPQALELLHGIAAGSSHAEVRLQAMSAMLRAGNAASVATAIQGLDDRDRCVRTVAAQLLGKLRRPAAKDPLLALLQRSRATETGDEPATDLAAALLALHDLGAKEALLPAATSLQGSEAVGVGEALTYYFQSLSPQLPAGDEVTLLLGVLDHQEALLRRYAIGRLGERADPKTASALEGRLATETPELRPLVEVALARVRKDQQRPPNDEAERALANLRAMVATASKQWSKLDERQRLIAAGGAGGALLFLLLLLVAWRRNRASRAAAASAAATAAMIAPSDEYLEEMAAEAEAIEQASLLAGDEGQEEVPATDDADQYDAAPGR